MKDLLKKLEINYKNIELYKQAFTHTSYMHEKKLDKSYETLEFLGDAIVELVVSDYLYSSNKYNENEMTKLRASYVCENALYEYATNLDFSKYIKVGVGEKKHGGKYKKSIVADVFEAFIAAIYLDLGFFKAKEVCNKIIVPYILDSNTLLFSDYKSVLQEALQTDKKSFDYVLLKEEGPSHNRKFKMAVLVDGITMGVGEGQSKKEAEQLAAKETLKKLAKK